MFNWFKSKSKRYNNGSLAQRIAYTKVNYFVYKTEKEIHAFRSNLSHVAKTHGIKARTHTAKYLSHKENFFYPSNSDSGVKHMNHKEAIQALKEGRTLVDKFREYYMVDGLICSNCETNTSFDPAEVFLYEPEPELEIEVGQTYKNLKGDKVKIYKYTQGKKHPYTGLNYETDEIERFTLNGKLLPR